MKRSALALLAASSLLWSAAHAATRPHYGGTLHVEMRGAPLSLDPADASQSDSVEGNNLSALIFDTLVTLDDRGRPRPALAVSWSPEAGSQRWQFKLRHGVTFPDGTSLTAAQVAASLRAANPAWKVLSEEEMVTVQLDSPAPNLPAELARTRNGIANRGGSTILGTGPFVVNHWEAGKKLSLVANEGYWAGRPFLDSIEIVMGQDFREQAVALDLGKADLIEVAAEQARHEVSGRHLENSAPSELMALVFNSNGQSASDPLREALSCSIDRATLGNILLQGAGEPASGLLPNWMTGYAFLFPVNTDLARARQLRSEVQKSPAWNLSYDANDPMARVVAERIILNARDAGLTVQLTNSTRPDIRLLRVPVLSLDAVTALTSVTKNLGLPRPELRGNSSQDLYTAESQLLSIRQAIPLLHLRSSYGMNARVKNWSAAPDGLWHLSDVWLSADK